MLLNLIKHQQSDVDKIHLYVKYPFEHITTTYILKNMLLHSGLFLEVYTLTGSDTDCFCHWYVDFEHTNLSAPKFNPY